jgi:hypothetical protein
VPAQVESSQQTLKSAAARRIAQKERGDYEIFKA